MNVRAALIKSTLFAVAVSSILIACAADMSGRKNSNSPSSYRSVSESTTTIRPGVNPDEILKAHNEERRAVGVPNLQWSRKLAVSAQKWADHLVVIGRFEHSMDGYGENLWSGTAAAYSQTQMVEGWSKERQFFSPGCRFPNGCKGGWLKCAHYTQIIWRGTKEIGCGLARRAGSDFLVCQYHPAGNIQGYLPY